MKVVLDANIIIADFNMSSPGFLIILASAKKGDIELHVPDVVLDEVFNKFRQRLEKSQSDISSEIGKFNKLARTELECEITSELVVSSCTEYESYIRKIIEDNNVHITPYPETSHKYLAKKAMLTKKPFNSNEKGYRDCLIWENIKYMISDEDVDIASSPEVVFITGNHKDFLADEGNLHSDLISELEDEWLKTDSVRVYQNLHDFNKEITMLFLEQANMFEGKLKNAEFWDFQLKSAIDKYLYKELVGEELGNWREYTPAANARPTIDNIDDSYTIKNISVKKLSSDEFIVDVEFDLEMEVDFYVDKSDHYSSENEDYYVVDYDWNDHVVHVSQNIEVPMSMSLIINSNLECKSIEINNFDDDYNDY
uniref:PIN domain-containing protein n=1 Tax=Pedobacter schmidteae TaxID=2201271 RepID=UPI000EAD745E|nr:PIN domain-containing protein [Pedobacter schmidteae]